MKIVFFGSPDFAVPSLEKILKNRYDVLCVVTRPDKPKGRGRKLQGTPVKKFAEEKGLPVYQPEDLKSDDFFNFLKNLGADLFVVVGFKILPKRIIELPPEGSINLHASLLPAYRGAAPIQWAILNGEKKTGVTVFFLNEKVDTGDIIMQEPVDIKESDTAGDLHDRLAETGSRVLVKSIDLIKSGDFTPKPQKGAVTKAPKITQDLLKIRWDVSAEDVRNKVRAFSPFPGAFSFIEGKRVKIFSVDEEFIKSTKNAPGTVVSVDSSGITVQCADRCIFFREIQMQGKRRMTVSEFLRGNSINTGMIFLSG